MIDLACSHIAVSFGGDTILKDVTFSMESGDVLGIVGVNGAGKSTLFQVITGALEADSGSVNIAKGKKIGMLSQTEALEADGTVFEAILEPFSHLVKTEAELAVLECEMETSSSIEIADKYAKTQEYFAKNGGYEFRGRCRGILRKLGFSESIETMDVSALSGGQRTKLALGRLLVSAPDILCLDEPTNHLDIETIAWLETELRAFAGTILVISHDRYFLDRITTHILEIEHGVGTLYKGTYSAFAEQKRIAREIQKRHFVNQQREIARIEAYIAQQKRWNRERNIIAAESRQKQLDKMERVARPEDLPQHIRMGFGKGAIASGQDVLEVVGLSKSYPEKPLFSDVSLLLKRGERLFVLGENGTGKSTLIQIIAGKISQDSGEVSYGYNVLVGYYDQENLNLTPENTVLDELWNVYGEKSETEIRTTLAQFLFCGDDIEKRVGELSGGEKARLTFAKLMLQKTNLLILDEPTNHLDIPSREVLEDALLAFDGTILAVSHDRYFLSKLATRILYLEHGNHFSYMGTYDEFCHYRETHTSTPQITEETKVKNVSAAKTQYLDAKRKQQQKRKRKNDIAKCEAEIMDLEARIVQLDAALEESGADFTKAAELYTEKEAAEEKLLQLYEKLESLQTEETDNV